MVTPAKLYEYFGVTGIASVFVWTASLVMLAMYARSSKRTQRYWVAVAVAALGFMTAGINFVIVSDIKIDQTEEISAGLQRGRDLADAEDPHEVVSDIAATNALEEAASTNLAAYSYRDRGKAQREADKKLGEKVAGVDVREESVVAGRMMKAPDVHRANSLARVNLLFARLALWIAVLLVIFDYLERFAATFGCYAPLPLASPMLDNLFPKSLTVYVQDRPADMKSYLERVVRKGETFVYFGPSDFWRAPGLPRLLVHNFKLWPLGKIVCTREEAPFGSEFVFESAWFCRYCFVVEGRTLGAEWLADLEVFLSARHAVRAEARRTVNIVWDLDAPIEERQLRELIFLCRETNYKLMVVDRTEEQAQLAPLFDEKHFAGGHAG